MENEQDMLPEGVETRNFAEFRVEQREDDDGVTIEGHAATFNDPYPIFDFEEQVAPGAFKDSAKEDDVRALFNHNPNIVLGRTKSGTLRLKEDKKGLFSEIDLPESRADVREAIDRGDVDQMSFGFEVLDEEWKKREDKPDLRTIKKAKLFDVSPVTFPANPKTDVAVQRHTEWRDGLEEDSYLEDSAEMYRVTVEAAAPTEIVLTDNNLVSDEPASDEETTEPDTNALKLAEIGLALRR